MAEWLNETARETFLRDGTHMEIFFLNQADGQGGIVPPPPGMERDAFIRVLKQAIRDHAIYGVVHVAEAWAYLPRQPNDHTFKQVVAGEIAVADLAPGDKRESLMVRMESRDGDHRVWLSPIVRSADGVALADAIEMEEPMGGRLGTLFDAV
jgi:hypothetical protein